MGADPGPLQAESASTRRLLLITNMWPSPQDPIFGIFVQRHVAALRELGTDVTVVANTDTRTGALRSMVKYALLAFRAHRAARRGTYDAVVGHYLYPTAAIAGMAARRAKAPLVVVSHGTDATSVQRDDVLGRASRRAVREAARVVTVSAALTDLLRDGGVVSPDARIAVVNMGIDTGVFGPDLSARVRLGVQDDERVVLYAGALTHGKGVDVLIDAFAELRAGGGADLLVIVGAGPLDASLRTSAGERAAVGSPDLPDRVQFTGRLEPDMLASWMAAADVFVLPSRAEGLGTVLLEAMACGTPCVGSSVGGIPEILGVPDCGELVPPDDARALARAIGILLARGKDNYSDACMRQAAKYSATAQARAMMAVVEEVSR